MRMNLRYIIKVFFVLSLIVSLILTSLVSCDAHEVSCCKDEECTTCAMIQLAQVVVNNILGYILIVFISFSLYFFLVRICYDIKYSYKFTMVAQKVQLNE